MRASIALAPATAALLVVALLVTTRGGAPSLVLPGDGSEEARAEVIAEAVNLAVEAPPPLATPTPAAPSRPVVADAVARVETEPPVVSALPAPRSTATPYDPVRVLLVGDSLAYTLPQGLSPFEGVYGFQLRDATIVACGIVRGDVDSPDGFKPPPDVCLERPQRWRAAIAAFQPDVAVLLPGLWDGRDHRVDGTVYEFGTVEARPFWLSEMRAAVNLLGSRGAHVLLLTTPLFPPGHPASISDERVAELGALMRQIAGEQADRVSVTDLNRFLYPDGKFVDYINGINVRGDGFHFSLEGALMVGRWLAPQLAALGR